MSTMVDIGSAMAKWVEEIEFHRDKVKELENKIQVAKELMTFSPETVKTGLKRERISENNKPSLRARVITTLAEKQEWLTATEIATIIQREGLVTESTQVNTLVATTANKLVDLKKIIRRKPGKRVQYAIPNLAANENKDTWFGKK